MALIVNSIDKPFKVVIVHEDDKLEFTFKQLDYKTKALITGLTTNVKQGQVTIDSTLVCFYNLKYGLKDVKGIHDEEGKAYKLKFEDRERTALTDACTDELLATEISDNLIYTARELSQARFPNKLLHPLTKQPLEGVEVIPAKDLGGPVKK